MSTESSHQAAWEAQKHEFRRGNTSAQSNAALRNKAVLQYIKDHPGCTAVEVREALGHGGFTLLQKHNLAFWTKRDSNEARWYLVSDRNKAFPG